MTRGRRGSTVVVLVMVLMMRVMVRGGTCTLHPKLVGSELRCWGRGMMMLARSRTDTVLAETVSARALLVMLVERRSARRAILFDPISCLALKTLDLPVSVAYGRPLSEVVPHSRCAWLLVGVWSDNVVIWSANGGARRQFGASRLRRRAWTEGRRVEGEFRSDTP